MKKKMMMVMAVAVAMVFIAGSVFAWGGSGGMGKYDQNNPKMKAMKEEMKKELGLTPEQDKLLEAERQTCRNSCGSLHETVKAKKDELRAAISKPGTTRAQVEPIVTELKTLEAQITDKKIDSIFAVKAILTPEQFAKLEAMKERHMKEWKEKHKGKGEKGPKGPRE